MKNHITRKLIFFFTIIALQLSYVNAQSVSGTVVSVKEKLPLIGAVIYSTNLDNGTSTDVEGNFKITTAIGDTLRISYLGYTTEVLVVNSFDNLIIELDEQTNLLTDIIVLGYSSKSKKELSASVTTLDASKLKGISSPNIETMLQGQVPGLTVSSSSGQPGAVADIRIRGITSINADKPPLFVVDGMIGGTFVPNDVENITVLKDAAAIGLYGSAGSAGVIIVNTKQGKEGKPVVSFSTRIGTKDAVTGNFSMMNGADLYQAQKQMWGESNQVSFLTNRPEDLEEINYDWLDAGFDQALFQNHNLSIRGKSNRTSYGFSADYFDEEGTFINTNFKRLNLRGNVKFQISDRLSFQTDVNAQFSQDKSNFYSWFEDVFWNMPWDNPYNEAGELYGPQYVTNQQNDWYGQFRRSFLFSTEKNELGSIGNNVVWSNRMKYDITDWLSFETRTRLDNYNSKYSQYYSPDTDEGLAINGFVGVNQSQGWGVGSTHFLRFNQNYGKHDFGAFIAHEGGYNEVSTLNFAGQNLSSKTVKVPAGASEVLIPAEGAGFDISFKGISFISEGNYSFMKKYFATAYFRRDGSSLFAENKRYGNFYGGSFAWLLSEEGFLKDNDVIDYLKFRLSYGLTGNSNIPAFLNLATYDITRQYSGLPAGEPNNPANPALGWETTKMGNAGVDLDLFGDKLQLNVDVYQKSVSGMLLNNPLPFSTGYQSRTENIGDMQNRGVEVAVNFNQNLGNVAYTTSVNFAYNQNEITKITEIIDQQTVQAGAIQQINIVGQEAFQWYMPKWLGVDPATGGPLWEQIVYDETGSEIDRVSTNVYSDATFQANGSAIPKMTGGFNNSFNYKDFGLSFLFTFQTGNKIYHYTREFVDSDGANTGINLMNLQSDWNRWEQPGDIATHPVLNRGGSGGAHQTSSRYIENGDYLRLRNVSFSYGIPKGLTSRLNINNATISINTDNLWTLTRFSGMDPEVGLSVEAFSLPGLSYLKYPISRQFAIALNVEF